ncbi:MAG: DMT family transporter [Desulfobaccales bacterium]|jgi:transporter family protein
MTSEGKVAGWFWLAMGAIFLWGAWGVLGKVAARSLPFQAVYAVGVLGHLATVVTVLLTTGGRLPWHPAGWAAALGAGLCTSVGLLCFYGALARGPAAVVVPLTSLYPVITVLLSRVLLQETLTLRHLAGIALAVAAGWLLSEG